MKRLGLGLALAAGIMVAANAQTVVSADNFESYANGSDIYGLGPWLTDTGGAEFIADASGRNGTKGVSYDTGPAYASGWAWTDITELGVGTYVGTVYVKVDTDTAHTIYSWFGLDAYGSSDAIGTDFNRIANVSIKGDGTVRFFGSDSTAISGLTAAVDQWHRIQLAIEYGSGNVRAAIDGVAINRVLPIPALKQYINDVDMYTSPTGYNVGHYDDYSVVKFGAAEQVIQAQLNLLSYSGSVAGVVGRVELEDTPGHVAYTASGTLDADGYFYAKFPASAVGTYTAFVKGSHWLRKGVGSVTLAGNTGMTFVGAASVINGDIVDDNVVDSSDYFALSDAYDAVVGDPTYSWDADLNGDGAIDSSDYFILSDAYDLVGE